MKTVKKLIHVFEELLKLSASQLDALDRDAFVELQKIGDKKGDLILEVPELIREIKENGWDIMNPDSYSGAGQFVEELNSLNDLILRFQAQEKYVIRQIIIRRNLIGETMCGTLCRKSAGAGYIGKPVAGRALDRAL
jgi:hypothetical protein